MSSSDYVWGEWPPQLQNNIEVFPVKEEQKIFWIWRFIIPGALIVAGIFLIYFSIFDLMSELGKALIVAGILSATVDVLLKQRLTNELKQDVFKAAMGYLFPEELREEVKFLYNFPLISQNYIQTVNIEKLDDQYVAVTTYISKTLINISNKKQEFKPFVSMDDWGIEKYPCEILELGFLYRDNRVDLKTKEPKTEIKDGIIEKTYETLHLEPKGETGSQMAIWYRIRETRAMNDDVTWVSRTPLCNPRLTITAPGFNITPDYGHRDHKERQRYGEGEFVLPRTMLPSQFIRVRWWPKKEVDDKKTS